MSLAVFRPPILHTKCILLLICFRPPGFPGPAGNGVMLVADNRPDADKHLMPPPSVKGIWCSVDPLVSIVH